MSEETTLFNLVMWLNPVARPDEEWACTMEYARTEVGPTEPGGIATALSEDMATAVAEALLDVYKVNRLVWSTYQRDSTPYDPDTFVTHPVDVTGVLETGSNDPEPLDVVLRYRKATTSGRNGRIAWRGALTDDLVVTGAGDKRMPLAVFGAARVEAVRAALVEAFITRPAEDGLLLSVVGEPLLSTTWTIGEDGKPVKSEERGDTVARLVTGILFSKIGTQQLAVG